MFKHYIRNAALAVLLSQGAIHGAIGQEVSPSSGEYLLFGKSMFDFTAGTNAYLSGGVPLAYSVNITLEGKNRAVMDGIMGTRTSYEPVVGNYDPSAGRIIFSTPLTEVSSPGSFVSLGNTEGYETLLCALKPYGIGYLDPLPYLVFTFSPDGRSLYPSSGFGAGILTQLQDDVYLVNDYTEAIYDAILLKKESGISFNVDHRTADITNTYPFLPINTGFRIYNTGEEVSDYVVASSSPLFRISNPSGMLKPGEFVDIDMVFTSSEIGEYLTTVTITNEESDYSFDVKALCNPLPDYDKIVTEGTFSFRTDPVYPWTLSDRYGESLVAVSSNGGNEMTTSSLYADVKISDKHAGILTWEGYCDPYHPLRDAFGILVDGDEEYVSNEGGGSTDGMVRIAPGSHIVEFAYVKGPKVNGSYATGADYAWIRGLSLKEVELEEHAYVLSADRVSFQPKTIVKKGAQDSSVMYIRNEGWEDIAFTGVSSDNEAFSAEIPVEPVTTFGIASVKLLFHTYTPGKHTGTVTLHTNAGDIKIICNGEAVEVPDFSPIVTNGEFDFDTTIAFPFTVEGDKAYNSSSQKKDRKATVSTLKADFEIPEGYYGELTWKARVSSAGIPENEMTDYATIMIDGDETKNEYYGERTVTHMDFAPAAVNFYPGQHFVCFTYNQAGDSKFEGDDRIEVSELSLDLKKMNDNEFRFWGTDEARFDDLRLTKAYRREVKLANFGTRPLQIRSAVSEGGFLVETDPTRLYNTFEEIPVIITYIPTKPGEYEGTVVLDTTAGEVRIKCHASVVDDPSVVMIEDFEDDMRLWKFIDADGDDATWDLTNMVQNAFHGEYALQSFSIHSDFSEGPIDDIALSPEFTVPDGGALLSFYLACYNPSTKDKLTILAGSGDDYENFQPVQEFDLRNVMPYYNLYECPLNEFAGRKIRLAFRHALDVSVMSFIAIDDIMVRADSSGVKDISRSNGEIVDIEYYSLLGLKVPVPAQGIYIRRIRYSDGTVRSEKIEFVK